MAKTQTQTQTQSTQSNWIDDMSFQASLHIEKGKQRVNILRGERAKTQKTEVWANKQEVKLEREKIQLNTEKTNLQTDKEKDAIASTNLRGTQASGAMNEIHWRQRLTKKAYAIGANPALLTPSAQNALPPTQSTVVDLVGMVRTKTKEQEKV
ncbi:MAG: hypothetical protein PUP92_39225 [Rhizonema sp. PD38]|nr:hypothetical protein [Rhizonema sp. PD38]